VIILRIIMDGMILEIQGMIIGIQWMMIMDKINLK
tara:strand:+ start:915 stop:1019 length:105 start_codon:yes stop_codon:yes gene_type:complete